MEQANGTTNRRKGKHLNQQERIQIEVLLKAGHRASSIAKLLGRHVRTIQREIKRGEVEHRNSDWSTSLVYNADRAQDVYDQNAEAKGPPIKLKSNSVAAEFIQRHISKKKYSPEVVAALMQTKEIDGSVCAKTIYNYIDQGWIEGVTNESLWEKRKRGQKHRSVIRRGKRVAVLGRSIDDRPEKVNNRSESGHWEIDLVVGGKGTGKAVLLTLVERRSRKVIIRKLKDRTQASVARAINGIERSMGKEAFKTLFKSITADNGSEFLDPQALEKSVFNQQSRTFVYYAHPYSSWERGTNENTNRMIRRFIPKGADIAKYTNAAIKEIEVWINNYPRKQFKFETAEERFIQEMAA